MTHLARPWFEGKDVYIESFRGNQGVAAMGSKLFLPIRQLGKAPSSKIFVNGCRVRTADFVCADGVVHTIDCVLQPNFRDDPDKFFGDTV